MRFGLDRSCGGRRRARGRMARRARAQHGIRLDRGVAHGEAAALDRHRAAPGQQLGQLGADELAAPAAERAHVRLRLAAPRGDHDPLAAPRARRPARTRARLDRAGADDRLDERDERRVARLGARRRAPRAGSARPRARARPPDDQLGAAPLQVPAVQAADLLQVARRSPACAWRSRRAPASGRIVPTGLSSARGGALAPGGQLARDRARARVERGGARQPLERRLRVALVAGALEPAALLARPLQPALRVQPRVQRVAQLQQVQHVLARVGELLGRSAAARPSACSSRSWRRAVSSTPPIRLP